MYIIRLKGIRKQSLLADGLFEHMTIHTLEMVFSDNTTDIPNEAPC